MKNLLLLIQMCRKAAKGSNILVAYFTMPEDVDTEAWMQLLEPAL